MAGEKTLPFWLMLNHYNRKKEKKIPIKIWFEKILFEYYIQFGSLFKDIPFKIKHIHILSNCGTSLINNELNDHYQTQILSPRL